MKNGAAFSILIVDDESNDLLIIDEVFKEIGYVSEVRKLLSGKALLHYLESITPGFVSFINRIGQYASDLLSINKSLNEASSFFATEFRCLQSEMRDMNYC